MNNNYNYYGSFPYGTYSRGIPNTFNNGFRNVPNMMYQTGVRNSGGFLSRLFPSFGVQNIANTATTSTAASGITFSGILNGASKTLGVINQAIPVFYQIKPIWNNAKTMLRVAKAMNSNDFSELDKIRVNTNSNSNNNESTQKKEISNNTTSSLNNEDGPTFFN